MPSEARRGFVRIIANYTRVVTVILLGLAVVPLLLRGTGDDGWALITLLGATIGLTTVIQETVRSSLIRELGAAYHSGDDAEFRSVYNAGIVISAAVSLVAVLLFAALWFILPLLEIPAHLLAAGRWLVVARGLNAIVVLLLAAPVNMYKVTERMVAHNAWIIANRLCYVIAAVLVIWMGFGAPGPAVTAYAVISVALVIVTFGTAAVCIIRIDPRLVPAPRSTSRAAVKNILRMGSWNAAAIVATTMHHRVGPVIMNLAFGLWGNLLLGLASQLTVAVRRLAVGMTEGVDAVSARLSSTRSGGAVRTLLHHSTRLHGFATFPVAVMVALLAEPVLHLWVGTRLDAPQTTVPLAVALVRIMVLGMVARALGDGWIRILYGAGHISRCAPLVLAGGVANPVIAGILLVVLPAPVRYTAVCWAFSAALVVVHGVLLSLVTARALRTTYGEVLAPLWRPLVLSLVCAPLLLLGQSGSPIVLVAAVAAYSLLYAVAGTFFVLSAAERTRFTRAALRFLPRRRTTSTHDAARPGSPPTAR